MGILYDVNVRTISDHLQKVFLDNELQQDSVIRKFRITATDGKNYETQHYKLSAIIAVGYKVNSERAVQFRKWATQIVQEFAIKGFAYENQNYFFYFSIGWMFYKGAKNNAAAAANFGRRSY